MSAHHDQAATLSPQPTGADVDCEARADLLVRMVHAVLDEARPPLASTAWTARIALDELRAMVCRAGATTPQLPLQVPCEALQVCGSNPIHPSIARPAPARSLLPQRAGERRNHRMSQQKLSMTSEQLAGVQRARDALDEIARLDAAIAAKDADIASAERLRDAASKALAERDADLALAADDATAKTIEQDVKKLTSALADARGNLERQQRIRVALLGRLSAAEENAKAERAEFQGVVHDYRADVLAALADEVALASRPLIDALHRYVIASSALGSHAGHRFSGMELPDLRNSGNLIFGPTLSAYVDGVHIRLTDLGDDPALHELHRALSEPNRVLMRFDRCTSRVERQLESTRTAAAQPTTEH